MNNMKKIILPLIILGLVCLLGCSSILKNNEGVFGKESKSNEKIDTKINQVKEAQSDLKDQKLTEIGTLSRGTDYSLNKVTNNSPPVNVAKQMNNRVIALANTPNLDQVKAIQEMVDSLVSETDLVRSNGEYQLTLKDKEIVNLQNQTKQLEKQKDLEVYLALDQAKKDAAEADQYKDTLNQMDSWFGLGAVFYGIKRLAVRMFWIFLSVGIIFTILRYASFVNPIAGTIFAVFEHAASYLVKTIQSIFPRVLNYVDTEIKTVENTALSGLNDLTSLQTTSSIQPVTSSVHSNLPHTTGVLTTVSSSIKQ